MKTKFFTLCISVLVMGCFLCGCEEEIKKDALEKYIYVNKSSLSVFLGDKVQLKANPEGESYSWTSADPAIATVTAAGLVEAVSVGATEIIASQGTSRTSVPVTVAIRVPLTDIIVDIESLAMSVGEQIPASAVLVPTNATEVSLVWTSENSNVATVSLSGKIKAVGAGTTKIIVSQGNIRKEISVSVIEVLDKTGWIADADSYLTGWADGQGGSGTGNGGYPQRTIDNDRTSAWHSDIFAPNNLLPNWVRVDMIDQHTIHKVELYLHQTYRYAKTVRIYTSNTPAEVDWELATTFTFPSGGTTIVNLPEPKQAQYLIIYFVDSSSNTFSNLAEIYVYGT